jgi:uncharacterized protein YbjT (DUF2867 family)
VILVLGATGTVGREVVKQLSAKGVRVRALVRTPARVAAISGFRLEVIGGDLARPASLKRAFEGVDRVLIATSPDPAMDVVQRNAIAAAKRAGVSHVIRISAIGAAADSPSRILRSHAGLDLELLRSGIEWTVLRPNFFMQNFLGLANEIAARGVIHAPAGEGRVGFIDARDVASVATAVLLGDEHAGQTYVLTGPDALSYADAAERIGRAIGRRVRYEGITPTSASSVMIARGMPAWQAEDFVALLLELVVTHRAAVLTNAVAELTGREPRTFEAFARDFASVFSGSHAQMVG